jgi:two-component system response regulator PhoP
MRILVVEDEPRLAENIVAALREAGFAVDHAADGADGLQLAEQDLFDLVVLDLMLPGMDGESLVRALRLRGIRTPVLILTARDEKETTVRLLNSGADDYLTKPFDLGELIARVKALIRRSKGGASPVLRIADLEIDTVHQSVCRGGLTIDLSPTEYRILEYLAHRPRVAVSKKEMLEHLYDYDWEHHSNVIEAHVSNLRRKLTATGAAPVIETLRHRGYRIRTETSA